MPKKSTKPAPTNKELRRLVKIASNGGVGWVSSLHEALEDACEQAMETSRGLDDLGELLTKRHKLSGTVRGEVAKRLKRIIAFNNQANIEERAFEAVGLGWSVWEADNPLRQVKKALRIAKR